MTRRLQPHVLIMGVFGRLVPTLRSLVSRQNRLKRRTRIVAHWAPLIISKPHPHLRQPPRRHMLGTVCYSLENTENDCALAETPSVNDKAPCTERMIRPGTLRLDRSEVCIR